MSDELMRYVSGDARVTRRDREVAEQAKPIHDRVRLSAFKADGAMALAGHIMEGASGLIDHMNSVAGSDPVKKAVCADFVQEALFQAKKIQRNLYNDWGL